MPDSWGSRQTRPLPTTPQANGLVEKFNRSIVKMIHGAIAEKRDPKAEVQKFLTNYRNTPHDTTGKCPSQLLMNRIIRTKVPALIPSSSPLVKSVNSGSIKRTLISKSKTYENI